MLKRLLSKVIQNIKSSSLARDKKQLIRSAATTAIVLVVILAIIIIRSDTTPAREHAGGDYVHSSPGVSDAINAALVSPEAYNDGLSATPSPTPTQEPPAITPPAEESDPSSSTDVSFESEPPATDTDINE